MQNFYRAVVITGFCLLLATLTAVAQVVNLEPPSADRIMKVGKWRFAAGDSTVWSNPDYNDKKWRNIGPRVSLSDNAGLWKTGRGWFRATLRYRKLSDVRITMSIRQFGSSEFYLDGKLLAVLRPPAFDSGGSQRINAFIPIPISDTANHVLAIRYAFRKDPLIGTSVNKVPLLVSFQKEQHAVIDIMDSESNSTGIDYLLGSIFSVLSLFHLLFYRANRSQRVNLALALTMFSFSLIFLIDQLDNSTGSLTFSSLLRILQWIITNISLGLLLLSVYIYLGRRLGFIFWGIIITLVVIVGLIIYSRTIRQENTVIPFLLVIIEYIRVSWVAKRRKADPQARLPWNSLKFSLYSILGLTLLAGSAALLSNGFSNENTADWLTVPMVVLGLATIFSIPIGLSFSLVGDYAHTYQSLRQQLVRVNELSAQTLAQEQEKQQLLANQNVELERLVTDRTTELNKSLIELRETQSQLVQREKLASLGELTAGIAHEIQNPLNFVNNFSEVSAELVAELEEEKQKPVRDSELETELLGDLKLNLEKITHHGGRASAIVKGMLEHSRTSAGNKQPTNLNALADEYLRLSFQGQRSKDKTFTCKLITDFDPTLGPVNLVSSEIGRVLLNLFNNAFYAVRQRQLLNQADYEPTVWVSTKLKNDVVDIRVRDNGSGIAEEVRAKIFQPFFTTKPTGEGTGLGLSLSYDIVTKGHSGTLNVDSQEGEYTQFDLTLPMA
jgi:two-component system NtrC family sensor kinase